MEIYIYTKEDIITTELFKEKLETHLSGKDAELELKLWKAPIRVRGMDPTVLIALVGAIGTAFGALLTGLLKVVQQTSSKKIIIQSQDGSRIEFPANLNPKEIDLLIEKAKKLDVQKIIIS